MKDKSIILKEIFDEQYASLVRYSMAIVSSRQAAEDVVQEVLLAFWKIDTPMESRDHITAYLLRSVRNRSINYIKTSYIKNKTGELEHMHISTHDRIEEIMDASSLRIQILEAIEDLPDRCKEVFKLSRFEHKSYQEIAERLNISRKTVENQVGIALRKLRIIIGKNE